MAEYYAVLSRAIGGLSNTSPETRRAVYDKARNALIGQLKAIEPPLPTTEISRQRLELEEAIRRVEREIQSGTLPLPKRTSTLSPPPEPVAAATPPPASARQAPPSPANEPVADNVRRSPQEIFRQAILDAESRGSAKPSPERPALSRAAPERPAQAPVRPARDRLPPAVAAPDDPEAPDTAPDMDDEADQMAPPPRPAAMPPMRGAPNRPPADPRLAPDYDYEGEGTGGAARLPVERGREMRLGPAPIDPHIDDVPASRRGYDRRGEAGEEAYATSEGRPRRSRAPLLILVLFLILAGGLAYGGWTYQTQLREIVASFEPASKPSSATAAATIAVAPDDTSSTKNGDRLLPPGQLAPAQTPQPLGPPTPQPGGVRVVGPGSPGTATPAPGGSTLVPPPAGSTPSGGTGTPGGNAIAGIPPGSTLIPPTSSGPGTPPATGSQPQGSLSPPATSTQTTPTGPAATQKATLYEEPTDPTVAATSTLAITGSVSWTFLSTSADGPEVVGTVTIPSRKMTVKITVRRNLDTSLPASHMVEVLVNTPTDFPGKSVQSVPTLVLKQTEDAKGDPLVGASATVAAGYYWIALSSAAKDLSTNIGLLQNRGWMDIRLVYATGQRAILTLQEGPDGQQAFTKAIAAWQTG